MPYDVKRTLKKIPFVLNAYHHFRRFSFHFCLSTILFWLAWDKEIVAMSLKSSGRFFPYLLLSLTKGGFRIEIEDEFFYPGEINPIVRNSRLPIRTATNIYRNLRKKTFLYDHASIKQTTGWKKQVKISYDYYSPHLENNSITMPYFMHPHAYYSGTFAKVDKLRKRRRSIRIFFAGTYHKETYSEHFHFPMMNRFQIIQKMLSDFCGNIMFLTEGASLSSFLEAEIQKPIVMSITQNTANSLGKFLLSYEDYLRFLSQSYFVLAPPGVCVPWSHTVIDGIGVGAIPILNNSSYGWNPPLEHGKNCITFSDGDELKARIFEVLSLPEEKILEMQTNVLSYYENYLKPESFGARLRNNPDTRFTGYVDAEGETARLYAERASRGG